MKYTNLHNKDARKKLCIHINKKFKSHILYCYKIMDIFISCSHKCKTYNIAIVTCIKDCKFDCKCTLSKTNMTTCICTKYTFKSSVFLPPTA